MTEFLKCPNCNAQLHAEPDNKIIRCEYCDSEIIIDNIIQRTSTPVNNYVNPENQLSTEDWIRKVNYVSAENYPEEMQKWKKKFHKKLIVQAILSALSVLLMKTYVLSPIKTDDEKVAAIKAIISMIILFTPIYYGSFTPLFLSNKKPCLPNVQILDIRKYTAFNCKKMLPVFMCAFFGGVMLMLILLSINP